MLIIGCDYHPSFQQIAFVDTDTGELQERRLEHREEAEKVYRDLAAQGMKIRVGMEASGQARWFERLLAELNIELWVGDATEIARKRERKQKTDRQDARLILRLLFEAVPNPTKARSQSFSGQELSPKLTGFWVLYAGCYAPTTGMAANSRHCGVRPRILGFRPAGPGGATTAAQDNSCT